MADSTTTTEQALRARQLEQKRLAVGAWEQGQFDNALILIDSVLEERMAPAVAFECWVMRAVILADLKRFDESLIALETVAPFMEASEPRVQSCFYYQRAQCHREMGNFDAALTDYSGSSACLDMAGLPERQAFVENNLAWLCLRMENLDEAEIHAERAITVGVKYQVANLAKSYETQAEIFLAQGKLEQAMKSIDLALEMVDSEQWREDILQTRDKIETKLLRVLGVKHIADLDRLRANMTRRALIVSEGNLSKAGEILGLKHKGVDWIISKHPELEQYRKERRMRYKSILKTL